MWGATSSGKDWPAPSKFHSTHPVWGAAPAKLAQLEQLAQSNDISLNQLVIQCCRYALDHLEPSQPE